MAFVIPWRDQGRWIWEHLAPDRGACADLLYAAPEPNAYLDRWRLLPPYIAETVHLAHRRPDLGAYDVVFAWEMRSALATAALRRRMPPSRRPRFVAVGPILKGPLLRALPVVRGLLADADRIVCFARAECDTQSRLLRLPPERFVFVPTPWRADEPISEADGGFVLALGHSGRDYPTLLTAVRDLTVPVTIVAKTPGDLGGAAVPSNVTVRYNTGHHETNDLIAAATLHVIPLRDTDHSAGQTVLLRAMARGKAVVVTDTAGVRDYVRLGESAVTVPAGDAAALGAAIERLWRDAAERRRIGVAAARSVREEYGFDRFATRMVVIADELYTESGTPNGERQ
jgi:glycosyltransferase involved in cell wall biosynthesis